MQGMHKAKVIGEGSQVGQKIGSHFSGFPAGLEVPERLGDISGRTLEGNGGKTGGFLTVVLDEFGLVVEGIDVTDRARAKDHQHLLGRAFEVSIPRGIRLVRIDVRTNGSFATETGWVIRGKQAVFAQQAEQDQELQGKNRCSS